MITDAEKIKVMRAFVEDGAKIEFRLKDRSSYEDEWDRTINPYWDWRKFDYRLAPERKKAKVWVNVYGDGYHYAYDNEQDARRRAGENCVAIAVPVEFEFEEGYGLEERK